MPKTESEDIKKYQRQRILKLTPYSLPTYPNAENLDINGNVGHKCDQNMQCFGVTTIVICFI